MPTVIIEGPKIDVETKREVVRKITEVIREIYKVHHVSIIIHDNETENVGVDGELLSDILAKKDADIFTAIYLITHINHIICQDTKE